MDRIIPTQALPEIEVGLAGGGRWSLKDNAPASMLMIDVYRGLHCPRCRDHLEALAARLNEARGLGLDVIAVSTDPAERAEEAAREWAVDGLTIGHSLPLDTARRLGCYTSTSIREGETDSFAEPGVFFVRPDLTLYGAVVGTFPFARPAIDDLFEVASIVRERDYPPRGSLAA